MATYTYLDMNGLRTYDGLIKQYINAADAKSIKFGKIEDGYLKLYKAESPASGATPDFSLELPIGDFASKVADAVEHDIAVLDANGDLADGGAKISDLETKAHAGTIPNGATATDIVGYAAEVAGEAEDNAIEASAVTVSQNGLVVTLYQGGNTAEDVIGTINIPADMVVQDGEVITYSAGNLPSGVDEPGTYLVLTLANASGQKVYINVADLIDTYTAAQGATQVQLAVNGRVLSATIVAGGVGTTELAADAVTNAKLADDAVQTDNILDANVTAAKLATDSVTTAKIADSNVTLSKLASSVQTSLGLADTAVQPDDIDVITDAEIQALFA